MNKRNMMNRPVLILNGDGQPLSRYPFSVNSMKKVLKSLIKGRVSVVKESSNEEDYVIIKGEKLQLPQIVMINKYINVSHIPKFSRKNVYLRDNYTCQYCGQRFRADDLTFDHVVPRCKGGITEWTNIVTACRDCNGRKGGKTLEESHMKLLSEPHIPTIRELERNHQKINKHNDYCDNDWFSREYWETELEE